MMLGVFNSFGCLMGSLLAPFGMTPSKISFYGALLLLSGIIACPLIGSVVGRTKGYLITVRMLVSTLAMMLAGMILCVQNIDQYSLAFSVSVVITGVCAVSLIPTCIDFAIETAFPIQPQIVQGLLGMCGQLAALMFGSISMYLSVVPAHMSY